MDSDETFAPLDATGGERRRCKRALEEVRLSPRRTTSQLTPPPDPLSLRRGFALLAAIVAVGSVNPPVKRCVNDPAVTRLPSPTELAAFTSATSNRVSDFFKLIFVHICRPAWSSIVQEWSHRPLLLQNGGQRCRFRGAAVGAEWDGKRRETSGHVTCEFYEAEEEILFSS